MGNFRSKNPFFSILNKSDDKDNSQYKNFAAGDVKVRCLEGEYFVEGEDCTLGPMSKSQLEALDRSGRLTKVPGGSGDDLDDQKEIKMAEERIYKTEVKPCKENVIESNDEIMKTKINKNRSEINLSGGNNKNLKVKKNIKSQKSTSMMKTNRFIQRQFRRTFVNLKVHRSKPLKPLNIRPLKTKKIIKDLNKKVYTRYVNKKKSLLIQNIFKRKIKSTERKETVKLKPKSNIKIKTFNLSYSKNKKTKVDNVPFTFEDINKNNIKTTEDLMETTFTFNNNINSPVTKTKTLGFTQPINNETIRYTSYANADLINWPKQKTLIRRMSSGFVQRFGCNVQLGDEPIRYRGNLFYTVNIDGKDQLSVLKCRNCLPTQLRSLLIQPQNNGEESTEVLNRRRSIHTPYNPELIKDYGTRSLKLSY